MIHLIPQTRCDLSADKLLSQADKPKPDCATVANTSGLGKTAIKVTSFSARVKTVWFEYVTLQNIQACMKFVMLLILVIAVFDQAGPITV